MIDPGARVWVFGAGASGLAAARLLRSRGAEVSVFDAADGDAAGRWPEGLATVRWGCKTLPEGTPALAVASPGLAADAPWIAAMRARGVPVIGELELGAGHLRSRCLAITGSSGKSTMVKWMSEAWNLAGVSAVPCGNYGTPLCEVALADPPPAVAVAEVSSFQLELSDRFAPEVGVLLNLHPNHLDRHGTMDRYVAAKCRLFGAMDAGSSAVVHGPWLDAAKASGGAPKTWVSFGTGAEDAYRPVEGVVFRGREPRLDLRGTGLARMPLVLNACGVTAAADLAGLPVEALRAAAEGFVPLPHRMQDAGTVNGVRYIDDSKATTLAAMAAAVEGCEAPVHLIAGGLLKESGLAEAIPVLRRHCRGVYLIGRAAPDLWKAWNSQVTCYDCRELESAIEKAGKNSRPGEVILLSPGCASFDQFDGYHHRGVVFQQRVRRLSEEKSNATT